MSEQNLLNGSIAKLAIELATLESCCGILTAGRHISLGCISFTLAAVRHTSMKLCNSFLTMPVVQVFVLLQLHGTFYQDCGLSLGSAASRSLAPRRGMCGMRFYIDFIRLNQPILLRNSSKHFYLIGLSSRFVFIIVFCVSK